MTRRVRVALLASALSAAAVGGPLVVSGASQADDTGVAGGVESTIELSLEPQGSGSIAATVTSTESKTRLEVRGAGADREVDAFSGPVTNERRVVKVDASKGGDVTFTYGPQSP